MTVKEQYEEKLIDLKAHVAASIKQSDKCATKIDIFMDIWYELYGQTRKHHQLDDFIKEIAEELKLSFIINVKKGYVIFRKA